MKTFLMVCVLAGGAAFAVPSGPAAARQDPGSQDPDKQAPIGKPKRDPMEGLYELRSRTVRGVPDLDKSRGYVAVTGRHMLVCLAAAGADPDYPLLRADVRSWRKRKEGIETVLKIGFYTDDDGEIHVEEPGSVQVRRIDLIRGKLRIWQDQTSFLDFERIE